MIERTITHGAITVTVKRATVRARLTRDVLISRLHRLGIGDAFANWQFANAAAQSTVTGMLWVDAATDGDDLRAAYEAWLDSDAILFDEWQKALDIVNAPLGDPALIPPGGLTSEKKVE